jgi:two-component system chemotaxis response regulator CheY
MWQVLVVDDEIELRQKIVQGLSKVAVCADVSSGEQAIKVYKESIEFKKPFDFILLDVWMPEMDGFEVLKFIRDEEKKRDDPEKDAIIIMTTAYGDSLMNQINMGWDDFITKPVDAGILIEHMKKLISQS